jgi:hypothetical protein
MRSPFRDGPTPAEPVKEKSPKGVTHIDTLPGSNSEKAVKDHGRPGSSRLKDFCKVLVIKQRDEDYLILPGKRSE